MDKKLLIIGTVWPEPTSSAAGWRMLDLIHFFKNQGYNLFFCSSAAISPYSFPLDSLGVQQIPIQLNNSSFDELIREMNPSIVLFDRYMIEEQFGWRVTENCPNAIKILDTEDLHFLRFARQQAYIKQLEFTDYLLKNEIAKREIAAILRCDLSLIISKIEFQLLVDTFKIPASILMYLPFLIEENQIDAVYKTVEDRQDIVFIGNYFHEPNWHTLLAIKEKIWPTLKTLIPNAQFKAFGAYPVQKVQQLQNQKERFLVLGRVEDARDAIRSAKVLLAPTPYGAGLKGKLLEAMLTGTPSVTTEIGAEGMYAEVWPGFICKTSEETIQQTALLYNNQSIWNEKQALCKKTALEQFNATEHLKRFEIKLTELAQTIETHRLNNFMGEILQYHTLRSTKFMSKWIEEKNKNN